MTYLDASSFRQQFCHTYRSSQTENIPKDFGPVAAEMLGVDSIIVRVEHDVMMILVIACGQEV